MLQSTVLYWIVDSRNSVDLAVFFSQLTRTRIHHSNHLPWRLHPYLPQPSIQPEQTTYSLFSLSSITGYEQPVNPLHLTQATKSLSTSSTLLPLLVGTTNTAGLDLTIGKRLIGTAGDSGVQDRLQNEERSPHTSPARGENDNKPQARKTTTNPKPEKQQQTPSHNNKTKPRQQQQTPNNNNPTTNPKQQTPEQQQQQPPRKPQQT